MTVRGGISIPAMTETEHRKKQDSNHRTHGEGRHVILTIAYRYISTFTDEFGVTGRCTNENKYILLEYNVDKAIIMTLENNWRQVQIMRLTRRAREAAIVEKWPRQSEKEKV